MVMFPPRSRGGAIKKILIVAAVLVLLLVAGIGVFGPAIASKLLSRDFIVALPSGSGVLKLRDVNLSWGGPQRASKITLDNSQGRLMADINAEVDNGLLALALGGGDVGTVSISGMMDLKEDDFTVPPGVPGTAQTPPSPTPSATGTPQAITIPKGLRAAIEANALDITYTPRAASGLKPVEIKDLDVLLTVVGSGQADLSIKSASPVIQVTGQASGFVSSSGVLDLAAAQIDLAADVSAPGELVEALARMALAGASGSSGSATTSVATPPTDLSLAVQARGGRLTLTDPTKPITLSGPVPQSVIELIAGSGASLDIQQAPTMILQIEAMDVPLPDASNVQDWRGANFRASLNTTPMAGTAKVEGSTEKTFRVEPIEFELSSPDLAQVLTMKGRTRAMFDGHDAGMLEIDAEMQGILDSNGAFRAGLPSKIQGKVLAQGIPTRIAEPFVRDYGIDLQEALGPGFTAEVTARTLDTGSSNSAGGIPPASITADISSQFLKLVAAAVIDEKAIRLEDQGLFLQADRAGAFVRPFLKDGDIELDGTGTAIFVLKDLTMPLLAAGMPDLNRTTGTVRLALGDMVVRQGIGDRPLMVKSLDHEIVLTGDISMIKLAIDHRLESEGKPVRAVGQLDLVDLATKRDGPWPYLDITPERLRPAGNLEITGLPSDGFGYVPADLREVLARTMGSDAAIKLDGSTDEQGISALNLAIASTGASLNGSFTLDGKAIRSTGEGVKAVLEQPGPLAQEMLKRNPDSPVQSIAWTTPLRVQVSDINLAIPEKGQSIALDQINATLRIMSENVGFSVLSPQGEIERIDAEKFDLGIALSRERGVSMKLDSRGIFSGETFSMVGALAIGKILGAEGVDFGSFAPVGTIEATGIPTSLVAMFTPENAAVLQEAMGPRMNLRVEAPAPAGIQGGATGERSMAMTLTGENLNLKSSVALNGRTVQIGQSDVILGLTPGLVNAAVLQYSPDLEPRPTLARDATMNLTMFATAVDLNDANQPDLKSLRPVRVTLTSPDDIVLNNLPGGTAEQPINAGFRKFEVGAAYVYSSPLESEGSLKAQIFEPSEPGIIGAKVVVESVLMNPPPRFSAAITEIDTVRVDRLLSRPGLLSDLMGATAGVELKGGVQGAGQPQNIDLTVESARVNTTLALQRTRDRIQLTSPSTAQLQVPAAWANRYLLAPEPGTEKPVAQFTDPVSLLLSLNRLVIATPGAPLKPGIFALDATASSPSLKLRTNDGQAVDVQSLTASVKNDESRSVIAFDINTKTVTLAGAGESEPVRVVGEVSKLADTEGNLTTDLASITADVNGTLPTALVDAIAQQQGMLVDLLGTTTALVLRTKDLSKTTGTLAADLNSDNAKAKIAGGIASNTFTSTGPATITLVRITPELSARYLETVIPTLSRVEKTLKDEPATIVASNLTLPTDGDTRKLNGVVQVDMGTIQFDTSRFFGEIVKIAGGRKSGQIGKKVKPFDFVVEEGVVRYEKIELPLGDFMIEMRGKVDLNERQMDLITFVPFYAVAEEIAGTLSSIPGLNRLTMIPIRTHGSFDNPKSEVKLDLIVRESLPGAIESAIPEEIRKALPPDVGDALKDLFKKKEKK